MRFARTDDAIAGFMGRKAAVPDPQPGPYNAGVTPTRIAAVRPARPLCLGLVLAAALLAAGCEEPETVRKYETPRAAPRAKPIDADAVRSKLDHMFAAIVPAKDAAWFFKLVVPAPAADDVRKPFDEFLATVDVNPGDELPAWEIPSDWTAEVGGNEMRAATIIIPHGDEKFEITVSSLPLQGDWTAFLRDNVNRWMRQLEQSPLDSDKIAELARKLPTKAEPATAFELVGTMQQAPMGMMGAAGMPAGHPPVESAAPRSTTTSPPPSADSGSQASAGATAGRGDGFIYELPAGWKSIAGSSMRKASFTIAAEGGNAEAAVFVFPAVGEMADPEANAKRWAGMVGLTNIAPDELKAAESKIKFGDLEGTRYAFYSPAEAPRAQGIIAALAVKGDQVWSMRLSGDKATVQSQSDAFNRLLESIKFE